MGEAKRRADQGLPPRPKPAKAKPVDPSPRLAPWLPLTGALRVGITAGASTPNNKIGEAVARVFALRGIDPATIG